VSPEQRRPDGTRRVGPTWESLIERQIREAMEEGAFTGLPHQGEPLPLEDDSAAGEWAMAHRMLRDAGVAPPWIEADKEARARLAELDVLLARARAAGIDPPTRSRLRRDATKLVGAANQAIERLNAEAPTDRQHRRLLDLDEVLRRIA
jgi:hypothetical protein